MSYKINRRGSNDDMRTSYISVPDRRKTRVTKRNKVTEIEPSKKW